MAIAKFCTLILTSTPTLFYGTPSLTRLQKSKIPCVVSKVSEVRKWCKKGKPPHAPTLNHATPVLNLAVPPHLTQQHEPNTPFRAILHPPKTLPPVSTDQYNTWLRRILSACRILGRNNSKTNSSTPTHSPIPRLQPQLQKPQPPHRHQLRPRHRPQPQLLP